MKNEELLKQYSKGLGSTGATRNLYLRYATNFLTYAEGKLDKETVNKYMERLEKRHYSDGTRDFAFRVIRTLFKRNGVEWPFSRGEGPKIREDGVNTPALHPDLIIETIEKIKREGEIDEAAFLALSTTYGLRRIEMAGLLQKDVRIKDKTIHIATAKHGRERTHLIPDEILPYLERYDFDSKICEFNLFTLWYRIESRLEMERVDQVGWHSIRRTLNTLLLDHLPDTVVMSFLRWKQRTSSSMPFRYSAQRFVGREGTTTKVVGQALDVDEKIFNVHPFIEYWR